MARSTAFSLGMVAFITDSHAQRDTGVDLSDEAKTSVFVFLCLMEILGYEPFGEIVPQSSKRGFVDYELRPNFKFADCWVEVKRFGTVLRPDHIHNYLVRPGRAASDFRVGILTNLRDWQLYGYSPKIGPKLAVRLAEITVKKGRDFRELASLVAARAARRGFKFLRRRYSEAFPVLAHEIQNGDHSDQLGRAMRQHLRNNTRIVKVPQNDTLSLLANKVIVGKRWDGRGPEGLTFNEARAALTAKSSAQVLAKIGPAIGGAPAAATIQCNLRTALHEADDSDA